MFRRQSMQVPSVEVPVAPHDPSVYEPLKVLGALTVQDGVTTHAAGLRRAGVPLALDETYIDVNLNLSRAVREGYSPALAEGSLELVAQYIGEHGLRDAALVGITYYRMGQVAKHHGFRTARLDYFRDIPHTLGERILSWDYASPNQRQTDRYRRNNGIVAAYLRTADFMQLFGDSVQHQIAEAA